MRSWETAVKYDDVDDNNNDDFNSFSHNNKNLVI